jgi:EF hand domain-containing protein
MKTQLLTATLAALIAGIPAGSAIAKDAATTTQGATFDSLDANKDGRVSLPEASADSALVEVFSAADKDGDGYLTQAEFENALSKRKQ